jgi:hypothetical protein
LATSLIFVRNQYIVRGDAANRKSGSESRLREKGQQESTLFVTTPIAKYGNRSVLILSSVSPLRVRAFAINGCMDISALYDSRDAKSENLAPITDVAIASNGEVLLLQAGSSRSVLKVPGPN